MKKHSNEVRVNHATNNHVSNNHVSCPFCQTIVSSNEEMSLHIKKEHENTFESRMNNSILY